MADQITRAECRAATPSREVLAGHVVPSWYLPSSDLKQRRSHVDRMRVQTFTVKGDRAMRFELWRQYEGFLEVVQCVGGDRPVGRSCDGHRLHRCRQDQGSPRREEGLVLTDVDAKDWTIKLGDTVVINRGGKESQGDLNAGDVVNVCYDKGSFAWTAHFILVQERDTKDCALVHGTVKDYDGAKKRVTFSGHQAEDWTFPMGGAEARLNREDSKIENIKIGDRTLATVEKAEEDTTLKCLMIYRM
jgi:hypothetical protein